MKWASKQMPSKMKGVYNGRGTGKQASAFRWPCYRMTWVFYLLAFYLRTPQTQGNLHHSQDLPREREPESEPYPQGRAWRGLGSLGRGHHIQPDHLQLPRHRVWVLIAFSLLGEGTHLCCQVMPSCKMLKPKQTVPVAGTTSTRVMLHHLKREQLYGSWKWNSPLKNGLSS